MFYYSRSINPEQQVRKFFITIGPRNAPRLTLEVMAPDAMTAHDQHVSMALPGERVDVSVVPTEEDREKADLAYLLNQEARERRRISEVAQWERACDQRRGCR